MLSVFGIKSLTEKGYTYSGFLFKDTYQIENEYYPIFNRMSDVMQFMSFSYSDLLKLSVEELNMFHYLSYHKRKSELEYWSKYFVELVKAVFGSNENKLTPD